MTRIVYDLDDHRIVAADTCQDCDGDGVHSAKGFKYPCHCEKGRRWHAIQFAEDRERVDPRYPVPPSYYSKDAQRHFIAQEKCARCTWCVVCKAKAGETCRVSGRRRKAHSKRFREAQKTSLDNVSHK